MAKRFRGLRPSDGWNVKVKADKDPNSSASRGHGQLCLTLIQNRKRLWYAVVHDGVGNKNDRDAIAAWLRAKLFWQATARYLNAGGNLELVTRTLVMLCREEMPQMDLSGWLLLGTKCHINHIEHVYRHADEPQKLLVWREGERVDEMTRVEVLQHYGGGMDRLT